MSEICVSDEEMLVTVLSKCLDDATPFDDRISIYYYTSKGSELRTKVLENFG